MISKIFRDFASEIEIFVLPQLVFAGKRKLTAAECASQKNNKPQRNLIGTITNSSRNLPKNFIGISCWRIIIVGSVFCYSVICLEYPSITPFIHFCSAHNKETKKHVKTLEEQGLHGKSSPFRTLMNINEDFTRCKSPV